MDATHEILKRVWGYDSFRPLQPEAIACVLERRDSVVVLPTGGGKSVCFQLPALAMDGMAIIVSPLISLMKDQVDALRANGVGAASIHSMLTTQERREAAEGMTSGAIKLLYVSPERLAMADFIDYLKRFTISFVAIDEAHCISHWGHDFRPEYRALRGLKSHFPGIAVHAFTATATEPVRADIAEQLGLATPEIIVGDFDRPNLVFRVEKRADEFEQLRSVIDRHRGDSGIVYCISRKKVDDITAQLQGLGLKAAAYHAGMVDDARRHNQDAFIREDVDIIVATVAFGMGIDKSNVRYVVHLGMPKSLEHYQQECGRAGRDGLEAECCLFYTMSDFMVWKRMLGDENEEGGRVALKKLNDMLNFSNAATCRHRALIQYFGQTYARANCGACDRCLDEAEPMPGALELAQKILSCVARLGQMAGPSYTALVLAGSREQRVLDKGHDKLSTWGLLAAHPQDQIRDWIEQLAGQDHLVKTGEYDVLQVTPSGRAVLQGQETPRLLQAADTGKSGSGKSARKKSAGEKESWEGVDRALFDRLRALRKSMADERSVPAFVIFSDASLRDMARKRPATLGGFLLVHGVGRKKCEEMGEVFVEEIRQYCKATGLSPDVTPPPAPRPAAVPHAKTTNATARQAFQLFEMGRSVAEVAEGLGRAESTMYQYLEDYVRDRSLTDPHPWVDSELFARVRDAIAAVGDGALKPIFLRLNEEVPYSQIRIAIACLRNEESA